MHRQDIGEAAPAAREFPSYQQLTAAADVPAGASWEVFGRDDEIGTLNFVSTEVVRSAASLVRAGKVISLNARIDELDPPILGRERIRHQITSDPASLDDRFDAFYPQASSQWDALAHVQHPEHRFYNGWREDQVVEPAQPRLGIERWARRGIATRFVLVDIAGLAQERGTPIDFASRQAYGVADIEAALERQDCTVSDGAILLFHFGWLDWWRRSDLATRQRIASCCPTLDFEADTQNIFSGPGLECSEDIVEWLWDHRISGAAGDNPILEATPFDRSHPDGFLHYRLIPLLGLAIGELWDLGPLARDCREDGQYDGLLTSAPLNAPGGIGSPANALALK